MEIQLTTIAMQQHNLIEQICTLATDYALNSRTFSIQDKIVKLNHMLFLISLVKEEDVNFLIKEEASVYKDAVEVVWANLAEIGDKIRDKNVKFADNKLNEEEDLSKLSKEELIARLKEATK